MKLPTMRIEPKEQKQNLADLILEQRDKIATLKQHIEDLEGCIDRREHVINGLENDLDRSERDLTAAKAEIADLLTVCQAVQRDLILRAEPDFDGSGVQVVNLSSGFWDELNRVIGKHDDTAAKSFDALILRKQAEAIEKVALRFPESPFVDCDNVRADIMGDAEILRRQADEAESAGGGS